MGFKYKFTVKGNPQQNANLERKIKKIWGRTKAMVNSENLKGIMRGKLWTEGVRTATIIDVVFCGPGEKGVYEKSVGFILKYFNKTRTFGEMGALERKKDVLQSGE